MAIVVLLVILALVTGVLGVAIKGLAWLLIIGLVLLVGAGVAGYAAHGRSR